MQKYAIFAKKTFIIKVQKKYLKVRDYFHYTGKYRGASHSIYNLRYGVPKEISLLFHNGSNYNFCFVIALARASRASRRI